VALEPVPGRRAVSFVMPAQRPMVPAGHLSLTAMKRPANVSLVELSSVGG
jgi:hypothetical protein